MLRFFIIIVILTGQIYAAQGSGVSEMMDAQTSINGFNKQDVLCVEIAGKKIIAALIPSSPTMQDLKDIKILTFPSKPWFDDLPFLFTKSVDSPLSSLIEKPHACISVSIFGPLFKNQGFIDVAKRQIPSEIEALCIKQSKSPLNMYTDSICWAIGCLEYCKLTAPSFIKPNFSIAEMNLNSKLDCELCLKEEGKKLKTVQFPFLAIILKNGVGVALVEEGKVSAMEIPYIGCSFPQLEKLCIEQGQEFDKFDVHQALGNRFFAWTLNKRDFEDSEMSPFLQLYNARFSLFLDEIAMFFKVNRGIKVKSIYVGGENSRFIESYSQAIVLNESFLGEAGIIPEVIQLLGCLKLSQIKDFDIQTYPSYDEIMQCLE